MLQAESLRVRRALLSARLSVPRWSDVVQCKRLGSFVLDGWLRSQCQGHSKFITV